MKKFQLFLLVAVLALVGMRGHAAMYIVGNDPFGGWKTNTGVEMTQSGTTYTATVDVNATVYFVFATQLCSSASDWTTFANYRLGPKSNGSVVTSGTTYTAYSGQGDNSFVFTGSGNYTFTFNSSNNTFSVTANSETGGGSTGELYVLGEAEGNSWDPSVGVALSSTDGNTFTGTVTFNGENSEEDANVSYFSFTSKLASSSSDWDGIASYRLTPVSEGNYWVTSASLGTVIGLNSMGTNVDIAFRISAGTYNITVNVSGLTCVITKVGGGDVVSGKGWPAAYGGVMMQGFYWDSYNASNWNYLTDKVQDIAQYVDVMWIPNSGSVDANGTAESMGYMPVYWLKHNTVFGTESQLRNMIATYKAHNTSIIMDMVLNHKSGKTGWVDFADETVTGATTGKTYSMSWSTADICNTDECVAAGYKATGAADTGEDFDGSRDLDHTGSNVQANIKTYEDYLINELGYDGFRYDMCKGYSGYYVGQYNASSQPTFSVGEYWDGNSDNLRAWLENTKVDDRIQTACFDFALKYPINSAFGGGTWSALADKGLSADGNYQRYSVTFIDNHDTGQNSNADCLKGNVMPANAFILTMPGTPCLFYKHYNVYTNEINNCIKARRAAGVHNQSSILTQEESNGGYILETQGTRGNLYLQLGGATSNGTPTGYRQVQSGDGYKLFITTGIDWEHVSKDGSILGYPVVSEPAGNYVGSVTLTVAPSASGTTLVYTIDGSIPTASSATITASTEFTFTENTTLKVGVLNGNQVENIESYIYTIVDEATSGINIYVKTSLAKAYIWAWTSEGSVTGTNWPGTAISSLDVVTVNDVDWYCLHVDADEVSCIFNNGDSGFENQTATINLTRDGYFIYPNSDLTAYNYAAEDTYLDVTEKYAGASNGSALYTDVYVMGNVNSTGWAANNGAQMTTTNGEKYTATIDFKEESASSYSYFSFTTQLASSSSAWSEISSDRFGATKNNYLISNDLLGTKIQCGAMGTSGEYAFKIPYGKYNLTLYLTDRILIVEKYTDHNYKLGDVNHDGLVDITDVTALIDRVLNDSSMEGCCDTCGDINGDGELDITDVTLLIDLVLS